MSTPTDDLTAYASLAADIALGYQWLGALAANDGEAEKAAELAAQAGTLAASAEFATALAASLG